MSATFRPRRLPTNAWVDWFRQAPRVALRAAPPVVLAGLAALVVSGGLATLGFRGAAGPVVAPLCLIPMAACLRARDRQVSTLRVLRQFLADGWRPALAVCAAMAAFLIGITLLGTLFTAVLPAALVGHAARPGAGLSLPAAVASAGLTSTYLACLLPEISFTVLLACDGLPGRAAYALARRAVAKNFVPMMAMNAIDLLLLMLPLQPWPLAPVLERSWRP